VEGVVESGHRDSGGAAVADEKTFQVIMLSHGEYLRRERRSKGRGGDSRAGLEVVSKGEVLELRSMTGLIA